MPCTRESAFTSGRGSLRPGNPGQCQARETDFTPLARPTLPTPIGHFLLGLLSGAPLPSYASPLHAPNSTTLLRGCAPQASSSPVLRLKLPCKTGVIKHSTSRRLLKMNGFVLQRHLAQSKGSQTELLLYYCDLIHTHDLIMICKLPSPWSRRPLAGSSAPSPPQAETGAPRCLPDTPGPTSVFGDCPPRVHLLLLIPLIPKFPKVQNRPSSARSPRDKASCCLV